MVVIAIIRTKGRKFFGSTDMKKPLTLGSICP